jgi:hypothetical protein
MWSIGIRHLVLVATAMVFDNFIAVGVYLTSIFNAAGAFLGPVVLTVLVIWPFKKHILN